MRWFERRDDPLEAGQVAECRDRFLVGRAHVLRASRVAEPRMLGADAGIVEPGGDRVRILDLSVLVGEHGGACSVQHGRISSSERCRAGGLDAEQPHLGVVEEPGEDADCVRSSAHAGDDDFRQPPLRILELRSGLVSDHGLQLADDLRIRRGADARANQVVRRFDVRDPVANRLTRRLLQRACPEPDGTDLGAE